MERCTCSHGLHSAVDAALQTKLSSPAGKQRYSHTCGVLHNSETCEVRDSNGMWRGRWMHVGVLLRRSDAHAG